MALKFVSKYYLFINKPHKINIFLIFYSILKNEINYLFNFHRTIYNKLKIYFKN